MKLKIEYINEETSEKLILKNKGNNVFYNSSRIHDNNEFEKLTGVKLPDEFMDHVIAYFLAHELGHVAAGYDSSGSLIDAIFDEGETDFQAVWYVALKYKNPICAIATLLCENAYQLSFDLSPEIDGKFKGYQLTAITVLNALVDSKLTEILAGEMKLNIQDANFGQVISIVQPLHEGIQAADPMVLNAIGGGGIELNTQAHEILSALMTAR